MNTKAKQLIATLFTCLGIYLSLYSLRLIVGRATGHSRIYWVFETLFGYTPHAATIILLVVGFRAAIQDVSGNGWGFAKRAGALFTIPMPFAFHMMVIDVTYHTGMPPESLAYKMLTANMWAVLAAGCLSVAFGFYLLIARTDERSTF